MSHETGALQDMLGDVAKVLRPGQTFRFGGTQVRRLTPMCIEIERFGSATVTVLTKATWEVIGVQLVIGGEYTRRDHGLYHVPAVNSIAMKQRFADEKLAQTITDELLGWPCPNCYGSGVIGVTLILVTVLMPRGVGGVLVWLGRRLGGRRGE